MTKPRKGRGRPVGDTIGGILVGFDQQIMRNLPPAHELVQKGAPVRGLSGDAGGELTITLPGSVAASAATATTDLLDTAPDAFDVCELPLRSFGGRRRFAGRVRTVRCHEDNVLLRGLVETPGGGGVLVVDGGGSMRIALLGDHVAGVAVANGWSGIVVHGCVRDSEALAVLPLGILALGTNPRPSGKTGQGDVDVPLTFGAATFRPGAVVVADEDGLVVTRDVPPG
jgi:regulator of ribonuclease activity A